MASEQVLHYLSHFMKQKEHVFINSKSVVQSLNKKQKKKGKGTEIVNKENKYITKTNALSFSLWSPWTNSLCRLRDRGV